jgi:glycosyltransferase involved in cell wall biosynthesis
MKIGFDAKRAFLNQTGLGNYSRNTLISLKRFYPDNDYILFTPEIRKGIFPEQTDFDVYSPDSPFSKIFKSLWRSFSLAGQLEKHDIDLFHGLTHELPTGIENTGVKSVVTIHDLIFIRYPELYKPVDRNIYLQKIKYSCKVANCVIAASNQTRDDLINFLNVDPQKIKVVYQGISDRFFEDPKGSKYLGLKEKYNLPEKYILTVGTVEPRKNQLNLVKALSLKKAGIPLVMVGRLTNYAVEISDFISQNKMDRDVIFLDQVDDEYLPTLYQNAELTVYISKFEGFGLPIIEAMASGCPVLAANTSCLPETGGEAAVYCDPGNIDEINDSLINILDNQELRNSLSRKGKLRAAEFTLEKAAGSLMDIYLQT